MDWLRQHRATTWLACLLVALMIGASRLKVAEAGAIMAADKSGNVDACIDEHPLCPFWKSSSDVGCGGYNKAYMQAHCRGSCDEAFCGEKRSLKYKCENGNARCADWEKQGECKANPHFMYWQCLKACSKCTADGTPISLPPSVFAAATSDQERPKGALSSPVRVLAPQEKGESQGGPPPGVAVDPIPPPGAFGGGSAGGPPPGVQVDPILPAGQHHPGGDPTPLPGWQPHPGGDPTPPPGWKPHPGGDPTPPPTWQPHPIGDPTPPPTWQPHPIGDPTPPPTWQPHPLGDPTPPPTWQPHPIGDPTRPSNQNRGHGMPPPPGRPTDPCEDQENFGIPNSVITGPRSPERPPCIRPGGDPTPPPGWQPHPGGDPTPPPGWQPHPGGDPTPPPGWQPNPRGDGDTTPPPAADLTHSPIGDPTPPPGGDPTPAANQDRGRGMPPPPGRPTDPCEDQDSFGIPNSVITGPRPPERRPCIRP